MNGIILQIWRNSLNDFMFADNKLVDGDLIGIPDLNKSYSLSALYFFL